MRQGVVRPGWMLTWKNQVIDERGYCSCAGTLTHRSPVSLFTHAHDKMPKIPIVPVFRHSSNPIVFREAIDAQLLRVIGKGIRIDNLARSLFHSISFGVLKPYLIWAIRCCLIVLLVANPIIQPEQVEAKMQFQSRRLAFMTHSQLNICKISQRRETRTSTQ